jgi:hypothetical protein
MINLVSSSTAVYATDWFLTRDPPAVQDQLLSIQDIVGIVGVEIT